VIDPVCDLTEGAAEDHLDRRLDADLLLDRAGELDHRQRVEPEVLQRDLAGDLLAWHLGLSDQVIDQPAREASGRGHGLADLVDRREPALEPRLSGRLALQFAARGLGEGLRGDQCDAVDAQLVRAGDGVADRRGDRRGLCAGVDLGDQAQPLRAGGCWDGERGDAAGTDADVGAGDGRLDVLRVVIATAENDEVLAPPGDVEGPFVEEPEVAGAQPGATIGRAPCKDLGALGRSVPVAARDPGTPHRDLADLVGIGGAPVGAKDRHLSVQRRRAAAGDLAAAARDHPPALERRGLAGDAGRTVTVAARHQERRFGEAEGREEAARREASVGEHAGEVAQRLDTDRLGAREGEPPAAEVQGRHVRGGRFARTQGIGEVGCAGDRAAEAADRLHPSQGALEEVERREQRGGAVLIDRPEDRADQPHVVERWQPGHA
jgi:hypothetical protein